MMKTILVIYSNERKTKKEIGYTKRYAFNTAGNVSVGDLIETNDYSTKLLVVEIFAKAFKYFNKATGDLSDELDNSNLFDIKTLTIVEEDVVETVIGWRVNSDL